LEEEEEEEDDDADTPVTSLQLLLKLKMHCLLQKFFLQEGNENSLFDKLEACAHVVKQIYTKQPYCSPSISK